MQAAHAQQLQDVQAEAESRQQQWVRACRRGFMAAPCQSLCAKLPALRVGFMSPTLHRAVPCCGGVVILHAGE